MQKKILVVDDEPNNLQLLRQILKDHYQLIFASSGDKALEAVTRHLPDLVLLDVAMPSVDGYEVCRNIKSNRLTENIPVIFVTAMADVEDESLGFDAGAVDYILKPVSAPVVLRRVQTHLSLVRAKELEESQREAIYMLGTAGLYNDSDTGVHIWRMAAYARALASAVGWSDAMSERIEFAAAMHDVGKIGIPDAILQAPRQLQSAEWETMKRHPEIGYEILSKCHSPIFVLAAEIARYHHEKWNGSGYPAGLRGTAIPESARIVALVDVFDALTMKRPYKKAWNIDEAMLEIHNGSGVHFEPRLVQIFESHLSEILELMEIWNKKEITEAGAKAH
ncbi:response regulator [Chitinimonas sp. BJB300]|uniref:response regulator n=1 Tax=Chitinimonas sp. BJB300 TaxID=1559339 RepID=UPI000C0EFC34|nr:HD domain-containing phosphohydrolase [Chitinimonas sp. BJB300]PHV11888.1 two-component system response regulator [Chitinimonas sp. BJB300]TSJ91467.1 response regulator [Chitinimonas sp. BJB300]